MARTRKTSEEKWNENIKVLEEKVERAKEHHQKLKKQLEDLKANPPTKKSRATVSTLIKSLSKDPVTLAKILTEAGEDQDKLKELLTEAVKAQKAKEKESKK